MESFPGACPQIEPMRGLRLSRYVKKDWSVLKEYPSSGLRCITESYSDRHAGKFKITRSGVRVTNGEKVQEEKWAIPVQANVSRGYRLASFKIAVNGIVDSHPSLKVLYTDYKNISIVWRCENKTEIFGGGQDGNLQALFVLTPMDPRSDAQQNRLKSAVQKSEQKLKDFGLTKNIAKLITVDHNNCIV